MKKILITGANSFIGSALCTRMLADGRHVRGTIRPSNRYEPLPPKLEPIIVESIGQNTDWSRALSGVDTVAHLAARVHIKYESEPDQLGKFYYVNVAGTERLARMAATSGCRRFVFMSSVKVNGERTGNGDRESEVGYQKGRLKETFSEKNVPDPQDPYAISKWEAEKVLYNISEETGMEIVILRSPLVYGPRVKANFLRLLKVVERGIPLPLADINNRRSLIYLENLVDAIVICMKHPNAAGQTYFVSDNEDVSTPDLIRRMGLALKRPARLFHCPSDVLKFAGRLAGKVAEMERLTGSLAVDISKIRRDLDWEPPFSMDQGLRETAMWYLKRRNISRKGAKTLR